MGALLLLAGVGLFFFLKSRKPKAPPTGMPVGAGSNLVLPATPAAAAAMTLKGVLHDYGAGAPQTDHAAKVFAQVAGVRLPPGGAGYVEAVRQKAAAALGEDPRSWPAPAESVT